MKIGTWNLDYWKRTCNVSGHKEYKTSEEISKYKEKSLNVFNNMNYDFLLLQETNMHFYFEKELDTQWPYEFKNTNKKIYHHKFYRLNWGNAIIVGPEYEIQKNNINRGCFKNYYGKIGQMIYDFKNKNENLITIINIYNKRKNGNWETYYTTLENIIDEIEQVIHNKNNQIILAGDFNGSIQPTDKFPNGDPKYIELFDKIRKIGFINCTENIGSTVSYTDYQNDYIFIKNIENKKKTIKHIDEYFINISDHYLIDCEIE